MAEAIVEPPSLPSSSKRTVVQITTTEMSSSGAGASFALTNKSSSPPVSPSSVSASLSGGNVSSGGTQHTFYKPRATTTASARRSRAESLTNSLSGGIAGSLSGTANYPPSASSMSRPHSFSRSRPPSNSYMPTQISSSASASHTHTGGILPPASFFHPKQPSINSPTSTNFPYDPRPPPLNANNIFAPARVSPYGGGGGHRQTGGRPSSGISTGSSTTGGGGHLNLSSSTGVPLVSSTSSHAREHGLIMLPLSHIHSRNSDGSTSGPDVSSYSDSSQGRRRLSAHGAATRVKPSREALLPIGEKDAPSGNSTGKTSPAGAVRSSLEKIFRRTTASLERERDEAANNKDREGTKPAMHDHARAASSLSVRLRRQSSARAPNLRENVEEVKVSIEPPSSRAQEPLQALTEASHATPVAAEVEETRDEGQAFEGVALDGQRFTYGPRHNWQEHPSRNTFFFGGRLLTGGDSPLAFLFSISVVFAIGGVWFGTTAVWWWKYKSPAVAAVGAYVCLLTIASMFATALRDPGILPRDLDLDPPYPNSPPSDGSLRVPLPRDLRVRSGAVRVKYCTTCKTYRPPRSSHCKLCDNCVEGCDHHCPWVNNCIGRRNYTSFFTFLFFANLTLLLVIITSALHLWLLIRRHSVTNFVGALKTAPGSAAAFIMSVLVLGPVAALFFYHVRLMLLNITTIEQVRNQAHRSLVPGPLPANPFTLSRWYRNLGYLMCRPVTYSYIDGPALVKHDNRLPNPGHKRVSRNMIGETGYESEALDHHPSYEAQSARYTFSQQQYPDASIWKGDSNHEMADLQIGNKADTGGDSTTGAVTRSTWDHD